MATSYVRRLKHYQPGIFTVESSFCRTGAKLWLRKRCITWTSSSTHGLTIFLPFLKQYFLPLSAPRVSIPIVLQHSMPTRGWLTKAQLCECEQRGEQLGLALQLERLELILEQGKSISSSHLVCLSDIVWAMLAHISKIIQTPILLINWWLSGKFLAFLIWPL